MASVKSHTHASNRAKNNKKEKDASDRKPAFKTLLDNPFRVQWPSVPLNVQNAIFAQLLHLLDGLSTFRYQKKSAKNPEAEGSIEQTTAPAILQHMALGLNQVTKQLDSMNTSRRNPDPPFVPSPPLFLVFVCRADVDPPILIDHLPHSIASFNSTKPESAIKLIPLPKGAEASLAEAIGIRRAAVLGLDKDTPGIEALSSLLDSVPIVTASWMTRSFDISSQPAVLIPTHLKIMQTSAPKDPKSAKARKAEQRRDARKRRKTSQTVGS